MSANRHGPAPARGVPARVLGAAGIALGVLIAVAAWLITASAVDAGASPASDPTKATPAQLSAIKDYLAAKWHPLHFKPAIESASNEQCLACHSEILKTNVRKTSPAGLKAEDALAWYETLDTYDGSQATFHQRHLITPYAKQVMDLKCNFCHQGHDPRDRNGASSADMSAAVSGAALRKTVDPAKTCLLCHGRWPAENMGMEGKWSDLRASLETPEQPNACLTCHAEQFRTVRHQVTYLKAAAIEEAAKKQSDVCFGCHGGRQWYRISYPYPRHPWPTMDASSTPDWAKDRPTESDPRYRLPATK